MRRLGDYQRATKMQTRQKCLQKKMINDENKNFDRGCSPTSSVEYLSLREAASIAALVKFKKNEMKDNLLVKDSVDRSWYIRYVPGDGSCFFHCLKKHAPLSIKSIERLRREVVKYIHRNMNKFDKYDLEMTKLNKRESY